MDELWKARRATSPKALADILLTPAMAVAIRREIRTKTGQRVEENEITRLLRETVIRPEAIA